jgi:hypothetical protein
MPMLQNPRPSNLGEKWPQQWWERWGKALPSMSVPGWEGGGRTSWAFVLCNYHYRLKPKADNHSTTSLSAQARNR